jgi:Kef-type K+ transport system membrane component KefB
VYEAILVCAAQIAILWCAATGFGRAFKAAGVPELLAFIAAGVLLGPTGLSVIDLSAQGATGATGELLSGVQWTTLVLLMLCAGMNLPSEGGIRFANRTTLTLAAAALVAIVPALVFQSLCPALIHDSGIPGSAGHQSAYRLVIALAVAVTSVPFLSKIFMDTGTIQTSFAREILFAAAIIDVFIWSLLPLADGLRSSSESSLGHLVSPLVTIAFAAVFGQLGPRLCAQLVRATPITRRDRLGVALVLSICAAIVGVGCIAGVKPMVSATIAGISVAAVRTRIAGPAQALQRSVARFSTPIYFALVGCSVDISDLRNAPLIAVFVIWSSAIKIGCVAAGMFLLTRRIRDASGYAVMVNTRGGPGIVLAAVTLEAGLIGSETFVALIMASILTSWLAEAWLRARLDQARSCPPA